MDNISSQNISQPQFVPPELDKNFSITVNKKSNLSKTMLIVLLLLLLIVIGYVGYPPLSDKIQKSYIAVVLTLTPINQAVLPTSIPTIVLSKTPTITTSDQSVTPVKKSITKKVYLLIFNPILESKKGQKLTTYMNWGDPLKLSQQIIDDFKEISGGFVNYEIVNINEVDGYPKKPGLVRFQFNDQSYLDCMDHQYLCDRDIMDYKRTIADYKLCEKRNNDEIDEVWMWAGPWMGFWESNLTGPGAFFFNSDPTFETACTKLLPLMGFSYERGESEMLEDFVHRTESVMKYVYGSWEDNEDHAWNRFTLLDVVSPGRGGCGHAHYGVNTPVKAGYHWSETRTVPSSCEDFINYPNMTDTYRDVNCQSWDCTSLGYFKWWFFHLPRGEGVGPDGKLNNWWVYVIDPQSAIK